MATTPTHSDVSVVEKLWIKDAQISLNERLAGKELKRLCALEVDDIIVAGGRLESWMLDTYNNVRPAILPYKHPLAKRYAETIHNKCHRGIATVAAMIRQRFWRMLKSIKYKCYLCKILEKKLEEQVMGQIPQYTLKPAPAWSYTSLDFFGPYEIKGEVNKMSRGKGFGVIFNCMLSRAIHLDIAANYGTNAFLLVLRRFISIRGCPIIIRSDRGSQLVAANKELKAIEDIDIEALKEFGSSNSIDWEFTSGDAPWQTACSEALIKSAKRSLSTAIGSQVLTFHEVQTVLFEVANILNDRPIGRKPTSMKDGSYLSPNDLLLGRSSSRIPDVPFNLGGHLRDRYQLVQRIVNSFWEKWTIHYFPSLLIRQKWHVSRRNVKIGDIVLVQDSKQIRGKWKLVRVTVAEPSLRDGFVRNVTIQ